MIFQAVASYAIFSFFVYYQQLAVKNFRGAWQGYATAMSAFAMLSMVAGFSLLVWFGIEVSWAWALAALAVGILVPMLWFPVEAALGLRESSPPIIAALGFIAIPISGYFLWVAI